LAQHSQCLGDALLEQQLERRLARRLASHFETYTLVFAASVFLLGLFCAGLRMIKARIGSGALRWRSFWYFDEWSLRGKLPFIGSLKCRPELQWRW
jgi:hypothetical protein